LENTFKILKNRNGQNDKLCKANITPERFCIQVVEKVKSKMTNQDIVGAF